MLSSINSSLLFSVNRAGVDKQVQAALICEFFKQGVVELTQLKNTQAVSYSRGVLLVRAPSSIYASELRPRLNAICDYINQRLNRILVERISIVIG